ncbi:cytochrome P450 [Actinokineospora globicatena]|uniref:Cytochrome P450 n=1 Tax=Actinokineospora globicatena TaxID=103729 RepID=A0A9W6VAC8_9PSEU|nr:cytochrome P450 [Actinokineospora globicatena]MCP2302322.1 Cytochrome P450 [Actinokineospora globicatena]GLW76008.1 cytochrome P450 [Actinokineospora globicatena]GLW82846.1 cytochrome P450 [Actinokineospora globicatena]GLW91848.1 cytochrome P450 [Actinokineospora globicatena]
MTALFDLNDPALAADRFGYYRRLRETDPVHRSPFGYWVLTRYDDVDALLRAPSASSNFPADPGWAMVRGGPTCPVVKSTSKWMLMQDGQAHRRMRRLIARVFTPRSIDRMRPRIQQVVDRLIDDMGDGQVDLIAGLALPMPILVVGELLGIPPEDRAKCRDWTDKVGYVIDPGVTPQRRIAMNKAEPEFRAYLLDLMDSRRDADPEHDLLSVLMQADADGEKLTDEEIVANILLIFNAGHETTVNLIANGMLALLQQPEALAALRADPSLMGTAVEELSRFDPPVQLAARIMTQDTPIGDKVIPAGETVLVLFDAAGRDPDRYPDPDRLDLGRTDPKSLAFSSGNHYCLGAVLGKLEASTVFTELLSRYSTIELATDDLHWHSHFNLRGLTHLPLHLGR